MDSKRGAASGPGAAARLGGLPFTAQQLSIVAVALIISGTALFRVAQPEFRRPIQWDELLTLRHYTWAGVNADGSFRAVVDRVDLAHLGKVGLGRLALGLYCAMGRWIEPNNHVPHSVLTNLTLLLPCDPLTALRLPALLAGCLFAALSAFLCLRRKLFLAAPVVALLAMLHPYSVNYTQESRGYALMMALCVCLVLALDVHAEVRSNRRWATISTGALALVASLCFINIISMSVDWVLPVMAVAALWPRRLIGTELLGDDLSAWRRSLIVAMLIVGWVGFSFFIDRLPFVISSARLYGVPFHSLPELARYLVSAKPTFAPNLPWLLVCVIGVVGAIASVSRPSVRSLIVPWAVAAGMCAFHFMAARRMPYPRNLGFFLPPLFFGCGLAAEMAVKRLKGIPRVAASTGLAAILAWALVRTPGIVDRRAVALSDRLAEIDALGSKPDRVVLFAEIVDRAAELWLQTRDPGPNPFEHASTIEVVMLEMEKHPFRFEAVRPSDESSYASFDGPDSVEKVGPYRIHRRRFAITEPGTWSGDSPVLGVWIPKFEAVSLSGDGVTSALKEAGLRFFTVHHRYQAKVNIFDRLSQVYVAFDASDPEQNKKSLDVLLAVSRRLGGDVYLLTPP